MATAGPGGGRRGSAPRRVDDRDWQGQASSAGTLQAIFAALGGWIDLVPRMPAEELARTINAGHAAMHEAVAALFADVGGWQLAHEVSFSIHGERGVIDILAWHPVRRTLLVIELKTAIVDANEIVGAMDRRRRLAPRIARERGWDPLVVSTWVAVADTRTNRRRLAEHVGLLRSAFPADGRAVRGWLGAPEGALAALGFLPVGRISGGTHAFRVPRRVRVGSPPSAPPPEPRIGVTFSG